MLAKDRTKWKSISRKADPSNNARLNNAKQKMLHTLWMNTIFMNTNIHRIISK